MIAAYPSTSRSDPSLGEASCGQQSSVTIEIVECLNTELSKADDSLNKVYGLILRELAAGSIYPNESPFFADWKRDLVKTERSAMPRRRRASRARNWYVNPNRKLLG
jgi:hypothetical protein